MTSTDLEKMSKEELIAALAQLREEQRRTAPQTGDPLLLAHELQVHQVELEMQNRQLREAQQLLEASRDRFASLYDFAPLGYCTLDATGVVCEANLTAALLLGREREKLIGRTLESVVGTDVEPMREHLRRCARENARLTTDLTWAVPGKAALALQMVSMPVINEAGETLFRTALIDVTALRESERRLRFLSDIGEILGRSFAHETALSEVVRLAVPLLADLCVLDAVDASDKPRRIAVVFADPEQEARFGERLRGVVPRRDWQTPEAKAMSSGQPVLVRQIGPDVVKTWAADPEYAQLLEQLGLGSVMAVPLVARSHTLGVLMFASAASMRSYGARDLEFVEDIAQRVAVAMDNSRLYLLAQRAVAARDDLLAIVSHDLRNPLGAIVMSAAELLDTPSSAERRLRSRKAIEAIKRAANAMNRLVGDLVDIASLEAGHLTVDKHDTSELSLLNEVLEMMRPFGERAGVTLTLEVPPNDTMVCCDAQRMVQVLANIVSNAIKFTAAGGSVTLRAERRASALWLFVTDTGRGIAEADLPFVFDRFWQATKTAHLGRGLGLSIAKAIAEAHGGGIWVESQVGVGSTFIVSLPLNPTHH